MHVPTELTKPSYTHPHTLTGASVSQRMPVQDKRARFVNQAWRWLVLAIFALTNLRVSHRETSTLRGNHVRLILRIPPDYVLLLEADYRQIFG